MTTFDWKEAGLSAAIKVLREAMPILTAAQARKLTDRMLFEADRAEREVLERWKDAHMRAESKRAKSSERANADAERERATIKLASGRPAHIILGVGSAAAVDVIQAAWRARAKVCHPDNGGSTEMMAELNAARDAMLRARASA